MSMPRAKTAIKTTRLSFIGISNFDIPIKGLCVKVDGAEYVSAIF
jgi:hypothetical protein